ncbi:MAG TPA: NAD(+) synthase [Steroidobacteraceae bacterium]|jgi:NAD+ synthase|nr:NAD(+) synthase [Steroidobacteraceae bacterium]
MTLNWHVLDIDARAEVERLSGELREATATVLHKRGAAVATSGGVDSAVCAALAARALGPERVLALILPEPESSPESRVRAASLAAHLGITPHEQDIGPTLEAIGCYRSRDEAVRRVLPQFGAGWRMKIVVAGGLEGRINHFRLVAQSPDGASHEARLRLPEYLQIVAATSFKQRVRKTIEYFHADRLNYAVIGTPNRLEYDQGFFVKNGDGAADVKLIAHLYKSQVYALAQYLGLPPEIATASPTTDTYSLSQGQDEFYFALPYREMDLALWALNHGIAKEHLAEALGMSPERAGRVYDDIRAKRRATQYLHRRPLLLGSVPEIAGE